MKLVVISPEHQDPREHSTLAQLFAAGLTGYHLRKPAWTRDQLAVWLRALPDEFHRHVVLHTHHDLSRDFPVGGLHDRDLPAEITNTMGDLFRSRAVHDLTVLSQSRDCYDRLLISPLFPSFTKPGHAPDARLDRVRLKAALALPRRAEAFALGGIDASRIAECRELGFDGVAVLGAIWQAADPLGAFGRLQQSLHAHAV